MELNKDGVSNKVSAVVLKVFPETKLYIVFASESISKGFRKKLKKLQKAIEV